MENKEKILELYKMAIETYKLDKQAWWGIATKLVGDSVKRIQDMKEDEATDLVNKIKAIVEH